MIFKKTMTIGAGSQFAGTEFAAQSPRGDAALRVREVMFKTGSESKTWSIRKVWKNAAGALISSVLFSASGSTATDVVYTTPDLDVVLLPGEQLQIVTSGATAAMNAQIQYEEIPNEPLAR